MRSRGELKTYAVLVSFIVLVEESGILGGVVRKAKVKYTDEKRCQKRTGNLMEQIKEAIKILTPEEKQFVVKKAEQLIISASEIVEDKAYSPYFLAHQLLLLQYEFLLKIKSKTQLLNIFDKSKLYFVGDVEEKINDDLIDSSLHFNACDYALRKTIWN